MRVAKAGLLDNNISLPFIEEATSMYGTAAGSMVRRAGRILVLLAAFANSQVAEAGIAGIWAVGEGGTIMHSPGYDGAWTLQESGVTGTLSDVFFLDARQGWAVGTTILHTTDGGATWTRQYSGDNWGFRTVHFSDAQHGWVAADSQSVLRTADGGVTWTPVSLPLSGYSTAVGSHFFDTQHGWLAFFGKPLMETSDGGTTWTARSPAAYVQDMDCPDPNHIWAVGDSGLVMHTEDGGATWASTNVSSSVLYDVDFVDPNWGWITGSPWWNLSRTTDGGQSWASQNTGVFYAQSAVEFADRDHGWVFAAHGGIRHTSDGGVTFTNQASPTANTINAAATVVPEPASILLCLAGGVLFMAAACGQRRRVAGRRTA
jgi:photosystem II stability/assembly factor-like uncharacterized protein